MTKGPCAKDKDCPYTHISPAEAARKGEKPKQGMDKGKPDKGK